MPKYKQTTIAGKLAAGARAIWAVATPFIGERPLARSLRHSILSPTAAIGIKTKSLRTQTEVIGIGAAKPFDTFKFRTVFMAGKVYFLPANDNERPSV